MWAASSSSAEFHQSCAYCERVPLNDFGQPVGDPVPDWTPPKELARGPLTGKYCSVVRLDDAHATDLWHAFGADTEGRDWTYLPYGPFGSPTDFAQWVSDVAADPTMHFYAIVVGGQARGVCAFLRMAPEHGSIEIGHIHFAPGLSGSPAATEALFLLMGRVFGAGYRRYEWKCDALNERSRAAALRYGFSFEGVFRNAMVYKGRNRDTAWFACTDADWPALTAAYRQWLDPAGFDATGRQRRPLSELTAPLLTDRV